MKKILGGFLICLAASFALADPVDAPQLAEANNGFAFDLLKQIQKAQPSQNIFISPYSASIALQMLSSGAAGQTRAEIQDVLNTKDFSPDELNGAFRDLNASLMSQPDVTLDLANSIWYRKPDIQLKPEFVAESTNFFSTKLGSVNFNDPKTADIINNWAAEGTRGKIKDLFSFPFPQDTAIILANAIYFKGKWADPFDKKETHQRDFYPPSGPTMHTLMMSQHKTFDYQQGDGFQAVKLPYAGCRLEMVLVLPVAGSNPEKLLAGFSGTSWNDKVLPQFSSREGAVIFPKFKLDYGITLNGPLQALGMRRAFDANVADFSPMTDDPGIKVEEVKQKSFVDVNEEGTEAAAVTTVMMTDSLAMPAQKPFEMIVNRPFFFVIEDNSTGAILFMGIVNDPVGQ